MTRWPSQARRNSRAALAALLLAAPAAAQQAAIPPLDCLIEPGRTVALGSSVNGILAAVGVERGDRVQEGEVVARVESSVEQATAALMRLRASDTAAIAAQQARLALAEARLARADQLLARNTMSTDAHQEAAAEVEVIRAQLDSSRMDRRVAEMELARAEAQLALHAIRSPIDGVVTQRLLSAGEYVFQDRHVLEIADLDPLHVEAFPPVEAYPRIAIGQRALVEPAALDAPPREAVVIVKDRVFDATSNTFGVRLALENGDGALPAGLRCRLTFLPAAD